MKKIIIGTVAVLLLGPLLCILVYFISYLDDRLNDREALTKTEAARKMLVPLPANSMRSIVAIAEDEEENSPQLTAYFKELLAKQHEEYEKAASSESEWEKKYRKKLTMTDITKSYQTEDLREKKWLVENANVKFVDRTKLNEVMKEYQFQLSDWADEKKTAQIGKALNADAIVNFKANYQHIDYDDVSICVQLEIFNITTFESVPIENHTSSDLENILKCFDTTATLPQTLLFDGIKKSEIKYKKKLLSYVCPFVIPKVAKNQKPKDSVSKALQNVDRVDLNAGLNECTVHFLDGSTESGRFIANLVQCDRVEVAYKKKDCPVNVQLSPSSGNGYISYVYHTSGKIGTIKIRTRSLDLSGDMFLLDGQFVIDYMSEKDNGTGRHYFAFFTTE